MKNIKTFATVAGLIVTGGITAAFAALYITRSKLQLRFRDRAAAANILANILKNKLNHKDYNKHRVLVLGIPRGGVTIADIVAKKLSADFDIIIGKKLLAPNHEENAIGAITEDDTEYLDQKILDKLKISEEYIEHEISLTKEDIRRRSAVYRGKVERNYEIKDKTVILVDDGAATGATIIAAARSIRSRKPDLLMIGLPVASLHTLNLLKAEADIVEVIISPSSSSFKTVEQFYQNYDPISHEEIIGIMRKRNLLV
jgi:putative phosphoribosyl transferase